MGNFDTRFTSKKARRMGQEWMLQSKSMTEFAEI
jgi:hypothetical protein